MLKIHFEINKDELQELASQNAVTLNAQGKIYLRVDGKCFPNSSWLDYPFILILMWMEDSIILLNKGKSELTFMEGPFSILLKRMNKEKLKVAFYDRSKGISEINNFEVSLKDFINELLSVSQKLISLAHKYDVNNKNNDFTRFKIIQKKLQFERQQYQ